MLIRKNWTRKVYELFRKISEQLQTNDEQLEVAVGSIEQDLRRTIVFDDAQSNATIRIRGPYSSSTSYMFDDCDHAIVIGGGIGECHLVPWHT